MSSQKSFKNTHPFSRRLEESKRVLSKYPDEFLLLWKKINNNKDDSIPVLDRVKFLVPKDVSATQFTYIIRKTYRITSRKSYFYFCK